MASNPFSNPIEHPQKFYQNRSGRLGRRVGKFVLQKYWQKFRSYHQIQDSMPTRFNASQMLYGQVRPSTKRRYKHVTKCRYKREKSTKNRRPHPRRDAISLFQFLTIFFNRTYIFVFLIRRGRIIEAGGDVDDSRRVDRTVLVLYGSP